MARTPYLEGLALELRHRHLAAREGVGEERPDQEAERLEGAAVLVGLDLIGFD
jgi:hypothetical protein